MAASISEIKEIILTFVRTYPRAQVQLAELNRDLKTTAYIDLNIIALNFGFANVVELLSRFDDVLKISNYEGARTLVEAIKADQISEYNRYSKKKKTFKYNQTMADECKSVYQANANHIVYEDSEMDPLFDDQLASNNNNHERNLSPPENLIAQLNLEDEPMGENSKKGNKTYDTLLWYLRPQGEMNFIKTTDKTIPKCIDLQFAQPNNVKSIIILEASNPHRFWFCEVTEYNNYKKLRSEIYSFYNANIESFKIKPEDMQPGLYVAVLHKKRWCRAKVLKLLYGTSYRVFLVDYGSVVDVDISNFRYLKENFIQYPALVHRGVLAYVQPNQQYWSSDANEFFYDKVIKHKVDAKLYLVSKENSYYMSIKMNVNGVTELVASEVIVKGLGKKDKSFLYKDPVNQNEKSFDEYEEGRYADISSAAAIQALDSWVPNVVQPQIVNQKSSKRSRESSGGSSTSFHERSPKPKPQTSSQWANRAFNNLAQNRNCQMFPFKRPFMQRKTLAAQSSGESTIIATSSASSPEKEKVIEVVKWQIQQQKFDNLAVGREIDICINHVENSKVIYFYNIDEVLEIKDFMEEFNNAYKKEKLYHTMSEIKMQKDVVVSNDNNFCRGRVISRKDFNKFEIYLHDYGIVICRKVRDLYSLKKEFMHRQAAVYKGQLYGKELTYEEMKDTLVNRSIKAKINSISAEGIVSLTLNI